MCVAITSRGESVPGVTVVLGTARNFYPAAQTFPSVVKVQGEVMLMQRGAPHALLLSHFHLRFLENLHFSFSTCLFYFVSLSELPPLRLLFLPVYAPLLFASLHFSICFILREPASTQAEG